VESSWVRRSAEDPQLKKRLLWIAGNSTRVDDLAKDLHRSVAIIQKYQPRRESLAPARQRLLLDEQTRRDALIPQLKQAIAESWMEGTLYFQGRSLHPKDCGQSFGAALLAAGTQALPLLYPYFRAIQILPTELNQLLQPELTGASTKFLPEGLGILELDTGRYVPACTGEIPRRVLQTIEDDPGLEGGELLGIRQFPVPEQVGDLDEAARLVRRVHQPASRVGRVRLVGEHDVVPATVAVDPPGESAGLSFDDDRRGRGLGQRRAGREDRGGEKD
jgi:hypothetical protein